MFENLPRTRTKRNKIMEASSQKTIWTGNVPDELKELR